VIAEEGGIVKQRIYVVVVFILSASPVLSQDRVWQLTLSDGTVVPQARLHELREDSLRISDTTGSRMIPVHTIVEIRYLTGASFWQGAKTGGTIGGIAGAIIGVIAGAHAKPSPETGIDKTNLRIGAALIGAVVYGVFVGILGGIIGGIIGAAATDEIHDLSFMPLNGKLTVIQSILTKNTR
jgi:hypothetical protein